MSQEDLAHELHMSISNISRMETGKYEVRMSDMFRWINVTQGQEILAAAVLSIDVGVLQKAIDIASTLMTGVITW